MAKSKKDNNISIVSLLIVLVGIVSFVFFFLPMIYTGSGNGTLDSVANSAGVKTNLTFFDFFQSSTTIEVIMAIVGVAIIAWDLIDTGLAFCFPVWRKFGKIRAFIQLITALVWLAIMIYVMIQYSNAILYAMIVLLVLAVISALLKALSAKDLVSKK